MRVLALLFALALSAQAQWTIQQQATTADLRGIDSVGKGIAWASGTNGTVLRTEDGGYLWQRCSVPPGAEKLDFRGIQAFDENTAIVMSSGKGDSSRLYQTTDGCASWALVATNADPDGFWDAIILSPARRKRKERTLQVLGDPVKGHFVLHYFSAPARPGMQLKRIAGPRGPKAEVGQSVFAASNSALQTENVTGGVGFGTGGGTESLWYGENEYDEPNTFGWVENVIPVGNGGPSSGTFSVVFRSWHDKAKVWDVMVPLRNTIQSAGVAVGGDYTKPNDGSASAAYTSSGGYRWSVPLPDAMPHGYRSAVAYDTDAKTWIAVGPNGTDVSTDDGHSWRALKPGPGDAPDADQHWNALSLPFVVGPKGRIGVLNSDALKAVK